MVTVHLDAAGRPDSLYASANVYCDDGGGGFLQRYGLRARMDVEVVTGTLRMAYDQCASGPVRFSARRQR